MEQKSNGALISSIIIVILLIVGGVYLWQTNIKNKEVKNIAPAGQNIQSTTSTDETTSIEQDLNNLNVNNLDQGL